MTRDELRERLAVAISGTTCTTGRSYRTIDAVLSALREEGLAVVPKRPDERLIEIGRQATFDGMTAAYRAMLAAGDLLGGKDG